jgi:hypothetical protein
MYLVLRYNLLTLVKRFTHLDTESLSLIGSGNDTSVIIAEHHHRFLFNVRVEDTFTGGIEIVTVDEGNSVHSYFVFRNICSPLVTTPLISTSIVSVSSIGEYLGFPANRNLFLPSG